MYDTHPAEQQEGETIYSWNEEGFRDLIIHKVALIPSSHGVRDWTSCSHFIVPLDNNDLSALVLSHLTRSANTLVFGRDR